MCRRSYLQNEQKERSWREVLQRSAAGGLNIHEFCRSEDLKETAFYFWKRMIAEGDREKKGVRRSAKSGRRSRREQNRKATAPDCAEGLRSGGFKHRQRLRESVRLRRI